MNTNLNLVLQGQDNLSGTLKNVQNELQGIKNKGKQLESLQKDFDVITNSSKSMKTQLRQIQSLMAQMNFDGLDNTPLFTQMAQKAGQLKDALGDAQTAVKAFANDNFQLEAMAQGMSLVASAGSVATGVMGLFGTENEKVTQAILKVQSALAILNGIQQIANVLNKDSALMLKLKQIRMSVSTATTKESTVATTANTVAEKLNGAQVKKNTIIQNAWNVAKAIGKAMLYDYSGLILLAAAGIATYSIATSNSTDEMEKQNKKLEEVEDSFSTYQTEVAKATTNVTSKMTILQTQWGTLRTEAEKVQWIKDNKSAFDELGVAINSVYDAENLFIKHTDEVVNAMIARSKAQAASNKLVNDENERDKKKQETVEKYNSYIDENVPVKSGDLITVKRARELNIYDGSYAFQRVTSENVSKLNKRAAEERERKMNQDLKAIDDEYDHRKQQNIKLIEEATIASQKADDEVSKYYKKPTDGGGGGGGGSHTPPKDKPKTDLEIYRDLEQQAKNIESRLKVGLIDSETAKEELDKINETVRSKFGENAKKIEIDLGVKSDLEIYSDFDKLEKEIQQRYSLNLISEEDATKQIDSLNKKLKEKLGNDVEGFKLEIKPKIEEGSENALEKDIDKITDELKNINPKLNPKKFNELKDQLKSLLDIKEEIEKAMSLEIQPTIVVGETKLTKGSLEDKSQSYDNTMSMINNVGNYYGKGLIDKSQAQKQIDELINQLQSEFPDIVLKVRVNDDGTITQLKQNVFGLTDSMNGVGSAVSTIGQAMSSLSNQGDEMAKAAAIATAIGQLVMSFASAMTQAASQGPWAWIAAGIAGVATLAGMISQLQGFSTGGIVGGSSYIGDNTLIRANAGEMVLNRSQQKNLYNAIRTNNLGSNNNMGGNVTFEIDGRKLKGVLNNVNNKLSRQS